MRKAFTLAEVLITLGIIGVVAAITMPILIQNHRKHVVETRLEKFYSVINQAITMAEAERGERENWSWKTTTLSDYEWFNEYLSKYIKNLKVENSNNSPLIYFTDGSLALLSGGGIAFYPEAKDYKYCKNLTNVQECSGKKFFHFFYSGGHDYGNQVNYKYITRNVEPYKFSWDGKESTLLGETNNTVGTNKYSCKKELSGNDTRAYCAALIQLHGWKIPKNYPLRF